jgi:hypothetical protein
LTSRQWRRCSRCSLSFLANSGIGIDAAEQSADVAWHAILVLMTGDNQHYLPAALIGGFGERRPGLPLRKARIVVRELSSGCIHTAAAEDVAFRPALYRLKNSTPGVDPDIVDKLWEMIEPELRSLVERLSDGLLLADDADRLIAYAAAAGIRHPTAFEALAVGHQLRRGKQRPVGDQIQAMRVEAFLNELKTMPAWRWRVLHSPDGCPRFVLSDRGWNLIQEPVLNALGYWLPLGPRVGILAYSDDAKLPPRRAPFTEHRDLELSWVEWFNAIAWSDLTVTHSVFAHPEQEELLRKAPRPSGVANHPYVGGHSAAPTLFH